MSKFARVAGRLFNAPLMLRPEKAEMLCAALVDRLGIAKLDRIDGTSLGASQMRQMAGDWYDAPPKTAHHTHHHGQTACVAVASRTSFPLTCPRFQHGGHQPLQRDRHSFPILRSPDWDGRAFPPGDLAD